MGKKKPFIDRKTASVYHVVRRSQRDVGTEATAETLSDFVLMPSPDNAAREEGRRRALEEEKEDTVESASGGRRGRAEMNFDALGSAARRAGLLDETASTYSRHTKPIRRSGAFVPASDGGCLHAEDAERLGDVFTDTSRNGLDAALEEAMTVREVGRMLDSIALTADCMDEDVAKALFDFEEGQFEEILDDFCITANKEEIEADDGMAAGGGGDGKDGDEFDYERHIQILMEKARTEEGGGGECGRDLEDDFFGEATPLHGRIEEEDEGEDLFDYARYGGEEVEDSEHSLDREFGTADERQRFLCQKFEEVLIDYDSDEVGDLDEECEEIGGDRPLEGDARVEAALDEFLTEKDDEILIEGTTKLKEKRTGGSGYSALVGKTMVGACDLDAADTSETLLINVEESKRQMREDLAEADAILARPEADLPPEEVLIDGRSYFSETPRNPWDCESILSTYSNLDNNPAVIGRSKKKKKKPRKAGVKDGVDATGDDAIPEGGPVRIRLSNKTGLPLGAFGSGRYEGCASYNEEEEDTYLSVNRGEARDRNESKMEKKQRKMANREERRICRMQKKMMKEAFREEFGRRGRAEVADAVGGSTVFRF